MSFWEVALELWIASPTAAFALGALLPEGGCHLRRKLLICKIRVSSSHPQSWICFLYYLELESCEICLSLRPDSFVLNLKMSQKPTAVIFIWLYGKRRRKCIFVQHMGALVCTFLKARLSRAPLVM